MKLVNPANKRKYNVIVVGSGLAGASAAASLAELGYNVKCFCYQDSPAARALDRRPGRHQRGQELPERRRQRLPPVLRHDQGRRLPRARGQRLPAGRGVGEHHRPVRGPGRALRPRVRRPARQPLLRRGPGLAHVLRARPDRPAAPARRLPGARAPDRPRHGEDVHAPRDARSGRGRRPGARASSPATWSPARSSPTLADAVVLGTGGYGNVFYLSTNAKGCNATAIWRAYKKGAGFANPCYTQIHPTCIPVTGDHQSKLTLMSESLRNDGRIWVPKKKGDTRAARTRSPRTSATTTSSASTRASATSPRATSPRARPRRPATTAAAWARPASASTSTSRTPSRGSAKRRSREQYGNLFEMYERITDENPTRCRCASIPPSHYTMGGLWVDYNLMSTIPGLHVLGEANFSDHGANRLGASALMQGLADGYFVLPYTIGHYLATNKLEKLDARSPGVQGGRSRRRRRAPSSLLGIKGKRTVDDFHRELGQDHVGVLRHGPQRRRAWRRRIQQIPALREEFWKNVNVPADGRRAQPVAREGGPGRRLPRARRADVPRRPRARRVVRRPFPRGVPDRGRRGQARRREVRARRGLGVRRARARRRSATSSPSTSRTSTCNSGATSEPETPRLASEERQRPPGPVRHLPLRRTSARDMSFLEMLDVRQRGADREGRGPHRLRPRLPRGHLRHLRHGDQRHAPRPARGHHRLPAPHAQVQGRRRDHASSPGAPTPSR